MNNDVKEMNLENGINDIKVETQADPEYATVKQLNIEASVRADADSNIYDYIGSSMVTKDYVDSQDATKQNTLVDNGINQNIKTINNQSILGVGNLNISSSGGVTKDYVDTQDALKADKTYVDQQDTNLQIQIDKIYYWKSIKITGAKTRTVLVDGSLQIGATYRIGYTWGDSPNDSIVYKEYTHKSNAVNDLERYWYSGVIGLLPNILALKNLGETGFQIYAAIGIQSTDGFINSVDILSKLN